MKFQNLFSGKNMKNVINLPSAELGQSVIKVKATSKTVADNILQGTVSATVGHIIIVTVIYLHRQFLFHCRNQCFGE